MVLNENVEDGGIVINLLGQPLEPFFGVTVAFFKIPCLSIDNQRLQLGDSRNRVDTIPFPRIAYPPRTKFLRSKSEGLACWAQRS